MILQSPLLEFESFLNPDLIDRVVKGEKSYWFLRLLPDEKPYGVDNLRNAISDKLYIVSDLHIGDPIDNWEIRRNKIIETINNTVGEDDHLLILGDLSAHANTASFIDVKNTIACLKCKNLYLIMGNNDQYPIESYVDMGFKTVTDRLKWREYLFTHIPEDVPQDMINIHGHLHEDNCYIGMDWHYHIKVWDDQFVPITLGDLRKNYNAGLYNVGFTINATDELDKHNKDKYFGLEESNHISYEYFMKQKQAKKDEKLKALIEKIGICEVYKAKPQADKSLYIVAFDYDSSFGKMVKWGTHSDFNHIAISTNIELKPMYTFRRENTKVRKYRGNTGFSEELLSEIIARDNKANMKVIRVKLTSKQYEKLNAILDGYIRNPEKTNYDFFNLFRIAFNRGVDDLDESDFNLVCSQFAARVLRDLGLPTISKPANIMLPDDIAYGDKVYKNIYKEIYYGPVTGYKVEEGVLVIDDKPIEESVSESTCFTNHEIDTVDAEYSSTSKAIDVIAELSSNNGSGICTSSTVIDNYNSYMNKDLLSILSRMTDIFPMSETETCIKKYCEELFRTKDKDKIISLIMNHWGNNPYFQYIKNDSGLMNKILQIRLYLAVNILSGLCTTHGRNCVSALRFIFDNAKPDSDKCNQLKTIIDRILNKEISCLSEFDLDKYDLHQYGYGLLYIPHDLKECDICPVDTVNIGVKYTSFYDVVYVGYPHTSCNDNPDTVLDFVRNVLRENPHDDIAPIRICIVLCGQDTSISDIIKNLYITDTSVDITVTSMMKLDGGKICTSIPNIPCSNVSKSLSEIDSEEIDIQKLSTICKKIDSMNTIMQKYYNTCIDKGIIASMNCSFTDLNTGHPKIMTFKCISAFWEAYAEELNELRNKCQYLVNDILLYMGNAANTVSYSKKER